MPSPSNVRFCPFNPTGKPLKIARRPSTVLGDIGQAYLYRWLQLLASTASQTQNKDSANYSGESQWLLTCRATFFIISHEWSNEWAGTGFWMFLNPAHPTQHPTKGIAPFPDSVSVRPPCQQGDVVTLTKTRWRLPCLHLYPRYLYMRTAP